MSTHNAAGVEYARLSKLRAGQKVVVDDSFTCRLAGVATIRRSRAGPGGLYIHCRHKKHFLDGQVDDGDHCVGITPYE